jgi:hypothetical protein
MGTREMQYRGVSITPKDAPIYWYKDDDTVVTILLPNGIDSKLRETLNKIFEESWATVEIR